MWRCTDLSDGSPFLSKPHRSFKSWMKFISLQLRLNSSCLLSVKCNKEFNIYSHNLYTCMMLSTNISWSTVNTLYFLSNVIYISCIITIALLTSKKHCNKHLPEERSLCNSTFFFHCGYNESLRSTLQEALAERSWTTKEGVLNLCWRLHSVLGDRKRKLWGEWAFPCRQTVAVLGLFREPTQ